VEHARPADSWSYKPRISAFKNGLGNLRKTKMGSSWIDPLSPRPLWLNTFLNHHIHEL